MRSAFLILALFSLKEVVTQYIANDVVSEYGQVKELLAEFYRRTARKYGHDYDPATVLHQAQVRGGDDGTEASINKHIWSELFENDIILTLAQAEALLLELNMKRGKRQAHPNPNTFWPNKTISYEFGYQEATFQNVIRSALRHIEQNTCIRFKENGKDRDGLKYFRGSGCWSNVGRTGGRQLISIGYGCESLGIIAHETLHALGLWHEQSRDDRDNYIRIVPERIVRGTYGNFEKRTAMTSENLGQPYDLGSVMHYGSKAFTNDWSVNTIETKDENFQNTIGQRNGLTFKDAKMINVRYCSDICRYQLSCSNDGYTDPNDCSKCRCPKGFGAFCGGDLTASPAYQTLDSGYVYANSNCVWRIKSSGGQRLEVTFDTVSFPCFDACTSFVEVKAARNKATTGARLCCKSGQTFYSEGDDVILVFKGDSTLQTGYQGFIARYRHFTQLLQFLKPAEWGIWGPWTSCSVTCGGGLRTRVRGCYGGNRLCTGSSLQTQYCNSQQCSVSTQTMCTGRVLLPCDLADNILFGREGQRYPARDESQSSLSFSPYQKKCFNSEKSPIKFHWKGRRSSRAADTYICEK
ncbi:unnamed protein product [Cylicocyclus nassatus]|uniref:Zinc metalloproteinase n=1 Tax=Cylicocyclus nassatus TaxID=53992 RepID=A0AA36GGE3_CYLNA|nr:unnamed protein product [Cylicocyclus nassatus]